MTFSALEDPRFPPIAKEEIPHLACGVSLLVDFETVDTYNDWTVCFADGSESGRSGSMVLLSTFPVKMARNTSPHFFQK